MPGGDTMVCGISSSLVQVTVVPAFTVTCGGLKVKLEIFTAISSARAGAPVMVAVVAAAIVMASASRAISPVMSATVFNVAVRRSCLEGRIDDGKPLLVLLEGDAGDAEHLFQLVGRHLH